MIKISTNPSDISEVLAMLSAQGAKISSLDISFELKKTVPAAASYADEPCDITEDMILKVKEHISSGLKVDQIAAAMNLHRKYVLQIIKDYLKLKMTFGTWRPVVDPPKKFNTVEERLESKRKLILSHCLDSYRLKSIAKEYDVSEDVMLDYINNQLHLFWDDESKMWMKN